MDAIVGHFRRARDAKEIHHHTCGIKPYGLFGGILDHAAEQVIRQIRAVHIGHIGAQHERWLLLAGNLLQKTSLAYGQLDGIRIRLH